MLLGRRTIKGTTSARKPELANCCTEAGAPLASYWEEHTKPEADSEIASRSTVFDGVSDLQFDLGAHGSLAAVTIDLRLRTKSVPSSRPPFHKTTPQMPFAMADKVGIYVMDDGYFVLIKDATGAALIKGTHGDPSKFMRLTLVSDAGGTVLYLDGVEAARSEKAFPIGGHVRVGAGHGERFWAGEVEFCDIYWFVKARVDFVDRPRRFDSSGRFASLDA